MHRIGPLAAALAATLLPATLAAQGFGQGPPPKNLQVLPKDMTRQEVVARMRLIATGLGVRCEYCHVSTTGPDGREQNDFAADDKDTKKTARGMLKMVNDINDKYLKELRPDLAPRAGEAAHHSGRDDRRGEREGRRFRHRALQGFEDPLLRPLVLRFRGAPAHARGAADRADGPGEAAGRAGAAQAQPGAQSAVGADAHHDGADVARRRRYRGRARRAQEGHGPRTRRSAGQA